MLVDIDQDTPRIYVAKGNPTMELILTLGGGIVFLVVFAFMVLLLFLTPDTSSFSLQPGIIGGMSVVPIMLISRGIFAMRNITRVTLDRNGIALESAVSFKVIAWDQIQRIEKKNRSAFMGQKHETLILLAGDGKELAAVRNTIDGFADLIQQIELRLGAGRLGPAVA